MLDRPHFKQKSQGLSIDDELLRTLLLFMYREIIVIVKILYYELSTLLIALRSQEPKQRGLKMSKNSTETI